MSCNFDRELLESLVLGELSDAHADEVEAHAAECESCADELSWLRLELEAFETRARADASEEAERDLMWDRISARIDGDEQGNRGEAPADPHPTSGRRPVLYFLGGFAAATAAAAALILWLQVGNRADKVNSTDPAVAVTPTKTNTPGKANTTSDEKLAAAKAALTKAENEYQDAIAALEATYKARRDRLSPSKVEGYDRAMASSHTALVQARKAAGDDIDARMRVLNLYSSHLNTLQTVVSDSDM
jgi:hypothetical protein